MYKRCLMVMVMAAACAKTVPAVSPAVSEAQCQELYHHMQFLAVADYIDPDLQFSTHDFTVAMWQVDQQWKSEGRTEMFYRVCPQMSPAQMKCAMDSSHLKEITECVKLQPGTVHAN